MISFFNTEDNLTIDKIKLIQRKYNLIFPSEYVNHLMAYNGGQCDPNIFEFVENGRVTESNIDWFLAIYEGEYDNLEDYILTYKINQVRLPKSFVPIAHDPGGNLICICCITSKIFFWDHEKETNNAIPDLNQNVYLIANNLAELLTNLK